MIFVTNVMILVTLIKNYNVMIFVTLVINYIFQKVRNTYNVMIFITNYLI